MKQLLWGFMFLAGAAHAQSALMITGVMDGTLGSGHPKVVELYARQDISDLSVYQLGLAFDGQPLQEPAYRFPAVSLKKGSFVYLSSQQAGFYSFFGWQAGLVAGFLQINGNDALALYRHGELMDVYGQPGQNGTGTAWEYTDGWAYRKRAALPGIHFDPKDWTFSGPNALDGQSLNETALKPFPAGSYSQIHIDGELDASGIYGLPLCVQTNATGAGDNQNPDPALADGSELDAVYGLIDGEQLCLLFTGNLKSDFSKLELFFDVQPGGQNRLLGNNPNVDFNGLNRMGDDGSGNGLRFDAGFEADYYLTISGGNDPYELFASLARVDNSGGFGEFLGGGVGRVHQLAQGITLAIDNRNTAGVQASGMQDPLQVQTGIEVSIPLKVLGNPRGDLNITAFINGAFHDQVSNQFLCPLPAGHPNPGEARNLDLETIPGPQFFGLCSGIEGGIIAFADGRLEQQLCEGDGSPDLLSFTSSSKSAASYAYILTDEAGRVQAISTSGQFDFEGSGFGIMQVWGVSYLGSLQLKTGDLLAQTPVSTDCYELSGNALRVIKDVAAGGHIFSSTGQNLLTTCRGDGRPDSIVFSAQGASGLAYTYLLTDTQNRFISVAAEGQEAGFDVEGNMADTLRLWGVSHAGALQLQAGVDITSSPLSGSCYELSENYLTILSDEVEGGSLELAEGGSQAIVCAGEAGAGMLEIRPHTTSIHPYRLVVTDASNQILALPPDREVDFSQLQAGRLRVWGVSYHGNFTASVGQPLHATAFSDDCFELSHNYIDVEQQAPQGGSVQFADGTFEQFWCVADRENKWVKLAHQQTEGPNYVYVETDQDGRVLHITGQDSLQIELQQPGVSLIRGLAFYGELLLQPGDTLPVADYADQCARLSANALTLTRDSVFGGTVSLDKGDTQWAGCVSDLASTPLLLRQQTPSRAPYVFLLSDTSGQVIQIVNGNSLAASGLLAGNYRLYGLSFSGQLLITPGAQLFAGPLASGCFDLSANFIELELQQHAGCTPTQLGQVVAPRQWRLYPNPTTELLNISGLQPGLHSHLSLYDAMGQQVLSRRIGQDHIQLSVGHLPAGIYTLRLSGSRGRDVTKLVIK